MMVQKKMPVIGEEFYFSPKKMGFRKPARARTDGEKGNVSKSLKIKELNTFRQIIVPFFYPKQFSDFIYFLALGKK